MRKAYLAITAILCAACGVPPGATQKISERSPRTELVVVWSQDMITSWINGSPSLSGPKTESCMPITIQWVDLAGNHESADFEPYQFSPNLHPKTHADAYCTQDGPVPVYLNPTNAEPAEPVEPVFFYRQRIHHFHAIETSPGGPCETELGAGVTECDEDLIRVCRADRQPMHTTPCNEGRPPDKTLSGNAGCNVCTHKIYAETPG
jgi:hypothetical protein